MQPGGDYAISLAFNTELSFELLLVNPREKKVYNLKANLNHEIIESSRTSKIHSISWSGSYVFFCLSNGNFLSFTESGNIVHLVSASLLNQPLVPNRKAFFRDQLKKLVPQRYSCCLFEDHLYICDGYDVWGYSIEGVTEKKKGDAQSVKLYRDIPFYCSDDNFYLADALVVYPVRMMSKILLINFL